MIKVSLTAWGQPQNILQIKAAHMLRRDLYNMTACFGKVLLPALSGGCLP